MSNKQLAVVLSKLPYLSLQMMAIFCCCDFKFAALKTFYDGKNMLPVILGNSEGWHGLAVYVKEGLPFARDLSLENSADSYLRFWLALLHSVSYFFFLYRPPSSSLCTVFDSISSNIDEVLLISPSVNLFVFGDFNVHHKDWITYSSWTDRSGELCYNFSISNNITQMADG